ncbi:ATP-binding protein [Streptomyces sp. NPDC048603]|uniref:ATP-binding protein n=1 Tax=Streptomyces sp. NPDC048603 TaxID=3365577 RepID=UPI00371E24ED
MHHRAVSACVEIRSDERAAGAARRFAAANLDAWGCADLKDDAVLICSELTTNAVLHGRAVPGAEDESVRLRLRWQPSGVLVIEVEDDSPDSPAPRESGALAESGRGIGLVAVLADRWAYGPGGGGRGKRVWACLRPSRASAGAAGGASDRLAIGGSSRFEAHAHRSRGRD